MSAIEFVMRDRAGNLQRGMISEDQGNAVSVQGAEAVSLNLRRFQAVGYSRDGDALVIELADGRMLRLNGYFQGDTDLYLSADGMLSEVSLSESGDGVAAVYQEAEVFGKWSPNDALFYTDGPDLDGTLVADAATGDDEPATMLATGILTGLGGIGGGGAAAAAVGGAALIGIGGGGGGGGGAPDTTPPDVSLLEGVVSVDHVFNDDDHSDGVEIAGNGEPGSTVTVEIEGTTHETTVDGDGNWQVVFTSEEVPGGERVVDVTVTASDAAGNTTTVTDTVRLDTITQVTVAEVDGAVAGSGAVINASGHADGVTMSGTGEPGSAITVVIQDGATATTSVDGDGNWSVNFPASDIATGEYTSTVTITSTDAYGNSASTTTEMIVDTVANVAVTGNNAGADGVYNGVEASAPTVLTGTAQAGSSVVVTLTHANGQTLGVQTITADGSGNWTATYPANTLPGGEYFATVTAVATDAAGNSETATSTIPVDTITNVSLTQIDGNAPGTVINGVAHADGVTMSGTGEPGGAITVTTVSGATASGVVDQNGNWNVNFPNGAIPGGETSSTVTVTIADAAGNTASSSAMMVLDTITNVAITSNNAGADNTYNFAEAGNATVLNGTAQPGASVVVTLTTTAGVTLATQTVIANGSGSWTAIYPTGVLPGGEYDVNVGAVATDGAGNTASTSSSFKVDTIANVGVNTAIVEGDNVINIAEAADGVVITGTADIGATVTVSFGGATRSVVANGNGNWSASYGPGDVPSGVETTLPVTASYTDQAGNTATASGTVEIDTIVRNLSVDAPTGDSVITAEESGTGFTLTGTTEPGARKVDVTFGSMARRSATLEANGDWSVTFGPGEIPQGEYTSTITVATKDRNGNTETVTRPVTVDTDVPEAPVVISYTEYTRGDPGVSGVGTELTDDIVSINQINGAGTVSNVDYATSTLNPIPGVRDGELQFTFNERIPDGSHLVINAEDAVGNESATLVVLDENGTNVVNATSSGLDGFNIGAIDLSIAEDSELTLNASDLEAMSSATNALIIHGDVNDTVNIATATATGQTETIGGKSYDVYTLGSDGTLIIDSDITVNT